MNYNHDTLFYFSPLIFNARAITFGKYFLGWITVEVIIQNHSNLFIMLPIIYYMRRIMFLFSVFVQIVWINKNQAEPLNSYVRKKLRQNVSEVADDSNPGKHFCFHILKFPFLAHWFWKIWISILRNVLTSVSKSQSGEGERRLSGFGSSFCALSAGDPCGSSGITANRPRCKHGDVGP